MKKYKVDIQLTLTTEDNHVGDVRQFEIDWSRWIAGWFEQYEGLPDEEYVDGSIDLCKVEEVKHGFRVLVDGEWCEPSDEFAKIVEGIEERLLRKDKE